jgi:hypothetical protein
MQLSRVNVKSNGQLTSRFLQSRRSDGEDVLAPLVSGDDSDGDPDSAGLKPLYTRVQVLRVTLRAL